MSKKRANQQVLTNFNALTPRYWLQQRLEEALAWADEQYQLGNTIPFYTVIISPLWTFIGQYVLNGGFLQGKNGLVYALFFSQHTFNKYAILYDKSHNRAEQTLLRLREQGEKLPSVDKSNRQSTISLVMIVKNEAKHLADCLQTVADIVDEIVMLDSGSTDETEAIARQYGVKWHVNTDWQGFGKQRQIAQQYATSDYVLVLDADERLDADLRQAINRIAEHPLQTDKVFNIARVNQFCGIEVQKRQWYSDRLVRLYARSQFRYCDLRVHEKVDQQGVPSETLNGYLLHLTNESLRHFLQKEIRYSHDWANQKASQGKKTTLLAIVLRPWVTFVREYFLCGNVVSGAYGFILACVCSGYTMNKYAMLWHKEH